MSRKSYFPEVSPPPHLAYYNIKNRSRHKSSHIFTLRYCCCVWWRSTTDTYKKFHALITVATKLEFRVGALWTSQRSGRRPATGRCAISSSASPLTLCAPALLHKVSTFSSFSLIPNVITWIEKKIACILSEMLWYYVVLATRGDHEVSLRVVCSADWASILRKCKTFPEILVKLT